MAQAFQYEKHIKSMSLKISSFNVNFRSANTLSSTDILKTEILRLDGRTNNWVIETAALYKNRGWIPLLVVGLVLAD